ncbi:MAG: Hpt domain-containing protein, partial [Burkholderiales bacterium]
MTIDMSQFYQVFFEESAELLEEMERLLLELDVAEPAMDDLNAIFRTAHSIKGGSATFGFNEITETTHILESLLDKLRNGELQLLREMVDVFLKSVDVIRMQLAGRQFESEVDTEAVEAIRQSLSELAQGKPAGAQAAAPAAPPAAANGDAVDPSPENLYAILTGAGPGAAQSAASAPAAAAAAEAEAFGLFAETTQPPAAEGENRGRRASDATGENRGRRVSDVAGEARPKGGRRASDHADNEATSIRVGVEKVDQLINLVGELVITQAMLAQTASRVDTVLYESLRTALGQLEHNTRDLQE